MKNLRDLAYKKYGDSIMAEKPITEKERALLVAEAQKETTDKLKKIDMLNKAYPNACFFPIGRGEL